MQMYTVRDYGRDLAERLALVRAAGFSFVEISPTGGFDLTVELLESHDLTPVSSGMDMKTWSDAPAVEENFRFLEHFRARGSMNGFFHSDKEADWVSAAAKLEEMAQEFRRRGFVFEYHNHDHEYRLSFGGRNALDVLFDHAPSLKYQMDIGWVTAGGADPVAMMERYRDRLTSVHVKDLPRSYARGSRATMPDLGRGETPIAEAVQRAVGLGVGDFIVENDFPADIPAFCRRAYRTLDRLLRT